MEIVKSKVAPVLSRLDTYSTGRKKVVAMPIIEKVMRRKKLESAGLSAIFEKKILHRTTETKRPAAILIARVCTEIGSSDTVEFHPLKIWETMSMRPITLQRGFRCRRQSG